MNIFQQETVEIVQWVEDVGHDKPATDLYVQVIRSGLQRFFDRVTNFYKVRHIAVDCSMRPIRGGMVGLDFAWFASMDTMQTLRREEPFLYEAFNTPPDMCMCQSVPGVKHNHEGRHECEVGQEPAAKGSAS